MIQHQRALIPWEVGNLMPSSDLRYQACLWCTYIHAKCLHVQNNFLIKKKVLFSFLFFFFEIEFFCVALSVLELPLGTTLALNSFSLPQPPKCCH